MKTKEQIKKNYGQLIKDNHGDLETFYDELYEIHRIMENIGFDGTGLHCNVSDRFNVELSDKTTFVFPDEPFVDPRIAKANLRFRNGNWFKNTTKWVTNKKRGLIRRLFG